MTLKFIKKNPVFLALSVLFLLGLNSYSLAATFDNGKFDTTRFDIPQSHSQSVTSSTTTTTTTTTSTTTTIVTKASLTTIKFGNGTVTSSPAGIDCGSVCSGSYDSGTPVTLTATAATGYAFNGWSGGGCSGTADCSISLNADTTVSAIFNKTGSKCTYTISANSKSWSASGGRSSIYIRTRTACNWTATSNADWITIFSNSSGAGNKTVGYSAALNTGAGSRTGTISLAGKTFTITQQGAADLSGSWTKVAQKKIKSKYQVAGTLTVNNTGETNAANVKIKVYLSEDDAFDGNYVLLNPKAVNAGSIQAKGSITKDLKYNAATNPSGKFLIAVVDPDSVITEADETNNIAVSSAIP